MLQRKTLNQDADLKSLSSSLQQYTPKAVEGTLVLLRPFLPEGVSMPDLALFLQLMLSMLIDSGTKMIDANWQRLEMDLEDSNLRDDRDGAVGGLRPKVFRIRDLFRGALGPKGPRLLALEDGVEELPTFLLHQVTYIDTRLREPKLLDGLTLFSPLDPVSLAGQLEPELTELRTSVKGLKGERSTEAAMLDLRGVQEENRHRYVKGAKIVEGIFRFAGMDEEADRIRIARRRSQTALPDETNPPDDVPPDVLPVDIVPLDVVPLDVVPPDAQEPEED